MAELGVGARVISLVSTVLTTGSHARRLVRSTRRSIEYGVRCTSSGCVAGFQMTIRPAANIRVWRDENGCMRYAAERGPGRSRRAMVDVGRAG